MSDVPPSPIKRKKSRKKKEPQELAGDMKGKRASRASSDMKGKLPSTCASTALPVAGPERARVRA